MVSHLFFYQLVLLGLLWLCVMLHYVWPNECARGDQRPSKPLPPRKRSSDPKPFPGLTRKPPCVACEQAHAHRPQPPGCPPPRIVPTRGRPRQVETSFHFCPHANCDYRGWLGLGNISANGHPSGGPWRQLHCTSCGGYFQETHGTPFHGKHVSPDMLVWAVARWRRAWASVPWPACLRSIPTRSWPGWSRWQSTPPPFRAPSCMTYVSPKSSLMSSLRCSVP